MGRNTQISPRKIVAAFIVFVAFSWQNRMFVAFLYMFFVAYTVL
jgi:hypothetical protein